jgi:hypothetical protein
MFNFSFRRVGGLYHWRVGRLGGSFYVAAGYRPIGNRRELHMQRMADQARRAADQIAARAYLASFDSMTANDW